MTDYPQTIVPVGHSEPVPRRVRAVLAGEVIVDTVRALYVWEWPPYPQYYLPVADFRDGVVEDEEAEEQVGDAAHGLVAGDTAAGARRCSATTQGRRHGQAALGRGRRLVRGGRAGVRAPAQPVRAGRRDPVHP